MMKKFEAPVINGCKILTTDELSELVAGVIKPGTVIYINETNYITFLESVDGPIQLKQINADTKDKLSMMIEAASAIARQNGNKYLRYIGSEEDAELINMLIEYGFCKMSKDYENMWQYILVLWVAEDTDGMFT